MSEATRMLDDLVAALVAGDDGALHAALGRATVEVNVDSQWITVDGEERHAGVLDVLDAFSDIAVTPVHRATTAATAKEQVVVSGRHVARFAGVEPSGSRVRMNVSVTAFSAEDGSVERLRITPDILALYDFADADHNEAAAALQAAFRENEARQIGGWQDAPVIAPTPPVRVVPPRRRRRGPVVLSALLLVGLAAGGTAAWRYLGPGSGPTVEAAALPSTTSSVGPSSDGPAPTPTPSASAVPSIAVSPTAPPKVQEGRQLVITSDVLFSPGGAELTSSARQALLDLAQQIRDADVRGTVQVNGYTDDVGTPQSNVALSRDRALAVAQVLQPALAGVPVTLQPQGFGEASPVATNATLDGRAKNRRVTVVLPKA